MLPMKKTEFIFYLANAKQIFLQLINRGMLIFSLPLPESVFSPVDCTTKVESCLAQEGILF